MTALTATTYSGNVSLSAIASETGAVVTIKKKVESAAVPVPPIAPVDQWRSPNMTIVQAGYEGSNTAIAGFDAQIDGVVQSIKASEVEGWKPTYLNPFNAPKTVYLRDLPEGPYTFALRAIDILGNKIKILRNYKFSFAFENAYGFRGLISEKIFDLSLIHI